VGKAVAEELINDAFAPGWRITLPASDDSSSKDDRERAAQAADVNSKLSTWHARTGFVVQAKKHKIQTNVHGGSILRLGVDDGPDSLNPLGNVKSFDWVRAFDRYDASASGSPIKDPASPHFTLPAHYLIGTLVAGQGAELEARQLHFSERAIQERTSFSQPAERSESSSQIVHADRVWRSDGPYLSDRTRIEQGGWGLSVYQHGLDSIKGWDSLQANLRHIVQDYAQVVYGIDGFDQLMLSSSEDQIRKRFALMDSMSSTINALVHDANKESVSKVSTNVSGLPDICDRFMLDVSAAYRIPITRLFGVSPGGFGTGESEGLNWRQQVEVYRQDCLLPMLRYAYGLLFQTSEFSVPEGWGIEFNPLDEPTEAEQSANRKTVAETDAIYIQNAVLDSHDVALSRFAGAEYSAETTISVEESDGREPSPGVEATAQQLNAESEASFQTGSDGLGGTNLEKVQDTALNGAQVTALTEMAIQVASGGLPAASAIAIARVGFPTVSPEEANAMFVPAQTFSDAKPDPVPNTIQASAPTQPTPTEPPKAPGSQSR